VLSEQELKRTNVFIYCSCYHSYFIIQLKQTSFHLVSCQQSSNFKSAISQVMIKEIDFAVEQFHRIAFGTKNHGFKFISQQKLASFVAILTNLLFKRYEKNWHPENPDRGSGYRCIRVNTQCLDPTIIESMRKAEIVLPQDVMTQELTIWVDPGIVSTRIGEDGSIGTEVVDEDVLKLKKLMRTASVEEDDCLSSRSSSPGSDGSISPPLLTTPQFVSPQRKSPAEMEYNPYTQSGRNYPLMNLNQQQRFRNNYSPPSPASSYSSSTSTPSKSASATRSFHSLAASGRSPLSARGSPVSLSPLKEPHPGQGLIPGASQCNMTYTRPRAIFPSSYESSSQSEGMSKMSYNPYAMPMSSYDRNMQPSNFYDIPAMA